MPKLKALLIHPDPEIRTALRGVLDEVHFIQVLGEAVSAFEAMELLEAIPYGVFFVAVDLPATPRASKWPRCWRAARTSPP